MIRIPERSKTSQAGTGRGLLSRAAAAPSTRGLIRVRSALDSVPEARRLDARPFQERDAAVGGIGKGLTSGAEFIAQIGLRLQEAEDTALLMKIDQQATEATTAFSVGLLTTDPKTWTGQLQKLKNDLPGQVIPEGSPDHIRRRARNNLDQDLNRLTLDVTTKSVMARSAEVRETILGAARAKLRDGKLGEANAMIDAAPPGVFDPGAKERVKSNFVEDADHYAKRARADMLTGLESRVIESVGGHGLETTLQDIGNSNFAPGVTAAEKERLRNVAQSVARDRTLEETEQVGNLIAVGMIRTGADVDAYESKFLPPAQREEFKALLGRLDNAGERERLADPEVQFAIYGDALARVGRWNKDVPGAEREYFDIVKQTALLPENLRGEITEPLSRKRTGKAAPPDKVLQDYADDRLTRLYDRGIFGKFEIENQYNPQTGRFETRIDPKMQDDASRVLSKTRRAMNAWLKQNPNASEDQIDAQMQTFMGGNVDADQAAEVLEEARSANSLFPGANPPDLSKADGSVKQTTGKVTKFGWPEDPHLDSNSAKGIAAFTGAEGIAAANRGEPHQNLLKRGDLAVSPDIEADLRAAGVEPGDFVEVTLADGTKRVTRWMDRTSQKLTGRWDFYTPDGQDPHDGVAVMSFSKIKSPLK